MPNALLETTDINDRIDSQLTNAGFDPETDDMVGALVDPLKEAIGNVNEQIHDYRNRSILDLASDEDLDEKLGEFSIHRGEIGIPYDDTYENFHVIIQVGKASDYILDINSPLVIPSDAITIFDTDGNQYSASDSIVINPDSFSGYCPISAHQTIPGGVGIDSINNCTIDLSQIQNLNPTELENISFGCSNNKAITTPSAANTDEELKDSAYLRVNSMNNTNENAITLALNNYGIFDIRYKRNMFGFGTLGVIAKIGDTPRISETSIKIINDILTNICPFSRVVEPEHLVVKFSAKITFIDDSLIDETKSDSLLAIQSYFNVLDLGSSVDPQTIKELVTAIENVDKFDIVCMFIDDRPCIKVRQDSMGDQLFTLNEDDPIVYVA